MEEGQGQVLLNEAEDDHEMEEAEEDVEENDIHPLMKKEGRTLVDPEWQWCMELKRAVEENKKLKAMTDFEIAKHAIAAGGNLQAALSSVERMQVYRDHYNIDHSVEQGMHYLEAAMSQQPGFCLHFDVNENHETIVVMDPSRFVPRVALEGNNWEVLSKGLYYWHLIQQPSIKSIRQGFYSMFDFGDIGSENFSAEAVYQLFTELGNPYPYKVHSYMAFNTGMFATMRINLAKAFMPQAMKDKIQLGCQIEESDEATSPTRRLRDFYLLPDVDAAQQRMVAKARTMLEIREHNERVFQL